MSVESLTDIVEDFDDDDSQEVLEADKMCMIYHIYFSQCDHKDALFVPCADREPRTKECPKGDPRQVRHTQDGPCEDCQPIQGDDDPNAVVESEQEPKE
ncbi:hypothetical protein GE21DRAFT_1332487 [Neurospora crassa]|nr:hypothetical protein GE21DRAFT_1332487 [Neurospora crassa]